MDKYARCVPGASSPPFCFEQYNVLFQGIIVGAFIRECSSQRCEERNKTQCSWKYHSKKCA